MLFAFKVSDDVFYVNIALDGGVYCTILTLIFVVSRPS